MAEFPLEQHKRRRCWVKELDAVPPPLRLTSPPVNNVLYPRTPQKEPPQRFLFFPGVHVRRRENCNHFLSRHVRERKYLSRR